MKYDVSKDLVEETTVKLEWHGDDTRVFLRRGDGEKTAVKKGDVVEVTVEKARQLVKYSNLWTLEGDEPVRHAFDALQAELAKEGNKKRRGKKGSAPNPMKDEVKVLTPAEVKKLRNKGEVVKAFASLEVTVNDKATRPELEALYKETYEEKEAAGELPDPSKGDGNVPSPTK